MAAPPAQGPGLRVQVPGSTSNLGPGFDLLGIALSLGIDVRAEATPRDPRLRCTPLEGTLGWPEAAQENLLLRAFRRVAPDGGPGYHFRVHSQLPVARGIGSSGAAVVAGLLLGNAVRPTPLARFDLLGLGIELEGHPDNVAASLFGGGTLCHPGQSREPTSFPIAPQVGFALAWPEEPMATTVARNALPSEVPWPDAVENPRRLPFLLEGLRTGDGDLIAFGGQDRLHVPYRVPLVPGASRVFEVATGHGAWLATLSGSGSAVIALGPREEMDTIAAAMAESYRSSTGMGRAEVVEVVTTPPRVELDHEPS